MVNKIKPKVKSENISIASIIPILVLVAFCFWWILSPSCSEKGNCKNGDCSTKNYNAENCARQIESSQKQSQIAFSCQDKLDEFIKNNNLTCVMDSISSGPVGYSSSIYECCRTCIYSNGSNGDYTKEVCKI